MQNGYKYNVSQLFNFAPDSYFERTSRPVYAIVFLLPFIIFYELGTIFINTDVLNQSQVRVVAFVWLQELLKYIGLGGKLAWATPALVVVIILAALQLASRKRWHFWLGDIGPMAAECILLAVPLIVLSLFLNSSNRPQGDAARFDGGATVRIQTEAVRCAAYETQNTEQHGPAKSSLLADIVTGMGAGIYEELIFRLVLICLLMVVFQDVLRIDRRTSIILAVLISAAMFSAHHHIVYIGGRFSQRTAFNWTEFGFRTIAGVYFAVLFAVRGFGIAAGTHAFYDIIATVTNAVFFGR